MRVFANGKYAPLSPHVLPGRNPSPRLFQPVGVPSGTAVSTTRPPARLSPSASDFGTSTMYRGPASGGSNVRRPPEGPKCGPKFNSSSSLIEGENRMPGIDGNAARASERGTRVLVPTSGTRLGGGPGPCAAHASIPRTSG